ncbi:MAG: hypothetical protein CSA65_04215 [Proteobacteria bacterium]|nr:MAG: hypothetical protein CSA65_04215 [Pseudomonadota bacterium]
MYTTEQLTRTDDPSADRQDGARAIEVTALFDETVLAVRHLDNPRAGKVSAMTWVLFALAAGAVIAGLVQSLRGQGGLGGLLLALGMGGGVFGLTRYLAERKSPHFVLGAAAGADLPLVHEAIPAGAFPLVRSNGRDFELLFTTQMKGDVTVGADRHALASLIADGQARPCNELAGCYRLHLPVGSRTFLRFGNHSFLISSVSAPRPVAAPLFAGLRWSTQVFTGLSFAAHALLLGIVFATPPDAKALGIDYFGKAQEFVRYRTMAKLEQKEVPTWLQEAKARATKRGDAGDRHRYDEGRAGKRTVKQTNKRFAIKGDAKNPGLAKTLAERTARQAGVLGLLDRPSGSVMASIFGKDSALGRDTLDALGGLRGDQIGESYGINGLGLVGVGRHGGGLGTGLGTVNLGRIRTLGYGNGGNGSYGSRVARLRRHTPKLPKVGFGVARTKGALDKELIRREVRRHRNEVRFCYQRELQNSPKLGGRLIVQFTIGGKGQVLLSRVQASTLSSAPVETCVVKAVRRWSFPKPAGGGIVVVSYPFSFCVAGR